MVKKSKTKKTRVGRNAQQSARFLAAARKADVDESGELFDSVFKKLVQPAAKKTPGRKA